MHEAILGVGRDMEYIASVLIGEIDDSHPELRVHIRLLCVASRGTMIGLK